MIDRPEEYGGKITYTDFETLEQSFAKEVFSFVKYILNGLKLKRI